MEISKIVNKEVTIGFGRDTNRLVVDYGKNKGFTLYAGDKKIEQTKREKIVTRITPKHVKCSGNSQSLHEKRHAIFFQLGRNRFLTAQYMGKDDLHVTYLPDEKELEYKLSPFMAKCMSRGLS